MTCTLSKVIFRPKGYLKFQCRICRGKIYLASYPGLRNLLGWTPPSICNSHPAGQPTSICSKSMMELPEQN